MSGAAGTGAGPSGLDHLWAGWRTEYLTAATAEERSTSPGQTGDGERCVFCRIFASGRPDTETHVVWRHPAGGSERGRPAGGVVALLNAYPYATAHLLVMPERHTADLETLEPDEATALWAGVNLAITAIKVAYQPDGLNVGANLGRAAGAGVPGHLHLHVLPRWSGDSNFMTSVAETRVLPEALDVTAEKLRAAWPG